MYLATRRIEIDAAHRVTYHGSKCRNLHGHRYVIEATVIAKTLPEKGEQQGMVLDFGFLKKLMVEYIDRPCDHGMIMWIDDPWLPRFIIGDLVSYNSSPTFEYAAVAESVFGKLYLMPTVPTAENLAEHWFGRLQEPCREMSGGNADLYQIKVWETPNCSAVYPSCPWLSGV